MAVVVALLPIWLVGLFGRGYWTPDEPREADIAWQMLAQPDKSVPQMAGQPFAEKPPLTYWLAAASMSAFGARPGAARLPNLAYAIVVVLAVGALGRAIAGPLAALVAGIAAGSFLLAYQVSIWLATDAPLVAGVAVALLGLYRGLASDRGRRKAAWYTLMHLGMLCGFLAKSAIAWVVPGCALLVLIAWERRWSELKCWELYVGFVLQLAVTGSWAWQVAQRSDGIALLKVMFWYNLAGRFVTLSAAAPLQYTRAHQNWAGKYLLQAPAFLAPWTLLAVAAGRHAYRRLRVGGPDVVRWKFVVAAIVPLTLLLSFSATARGIYLAPVLPAVGVMIGLWVNDRLAVPDAVELRLLRATAWLVIGIVAVMALAVTIVAIAVWHIGHLDPWRATAVFVGCLGAVGFSVRALRLMQVPVRQSALASLYAAHCTLIVGVGLFLLPLINTSQDLPSVATRIRELIDARPLALFQPDETTLAMLDYGTSVPRPTAVTDPDEGRALVEANALAREDPSLRWLVQIPTHAPGPISDTLRRWRVIKGSQDTIPHGSVAILSEALRLQTLAVIELPEGRRYALLAAPRSVDRVGRRTRSSVRHGARTHHGRQHAKTHFNLIA
jgi:4-amino-4-deoxy-L-arabinose transferase-like glycosyltransferase